MPKNGEAGNCEVRSGRIAGNSRVGNTTSELEWKRSADRNCLFYANWRVSTENRNKWAGIIKWFSAWTHYFHDLLEAKSLWTKKWANVLFPSEVTLDIWLLLRRTVENS